MDEAAFKSLVSGERRGVGAALARAALTAASIPYRMAVAARNGLFDLGLNKPFTAGVPVVSIGNVTAGGTGKTPLVAWVAQWLQSRGIRPVILSRGYRSLDGEANDEKLVLDRLCPGVPHVQNRDRIAGARVAIDRQGAQALVLDDGFQHRRIARDLDIVLIDALNPWGYGHLLPRGLLREPLTALQRAGVIIITRADLVPPERMEDIVAAIRRAGSNVPVVQVAFQPTSLIDVAGSSFPLVENTGRRVLAFCGIGNPEGFLSVVRQCGMEIAASATFPDHHHYGPADLEQLGTKASNVRAESLITTEKDLVKIPAGALAGLPVRAIRIGAKPIDNAGALTDSLEQALKRLTRSGSRAEG